MKKIAAFCLVLVALLPTAFVKPPLPPTTRPVASATRTPERVRRQAARPATRRRNAVSPNIVYVYLDDLGLEEIAPYGNRNGEPPVFKTPNLSRMATEGLRFTRHYAGTAVCAPSRCALMTACTPGIARCGATSSGKTGRCQFQKPR